MAVSPGWVYECSRRGELVHPIPVGGWVGGPRGGFCMCGAGDFRPAVGLPSWPDVGWKSVRNVT